MKDTYMWLSPDRKRVFFEVGILDLYRAPHKDGYQFSMDLKELIFSIKRLTDEEDPS